MKKVSNCDIRGKGLSVFDKSNKNIIWMKTEENSLNSKNNTSITCAYNSPKNLTYTKENECNVLELIEKELAKFSE